MSRKMRVHMFPTFAGVDEGDGGVRRVVEEQLKGFKRLQIDVVKDPFEADLIASHISLPSAYVHNHPETPIVAHCHGLYWSDLAWPEWAYKANSEVLDAIKCADIVTAPSEWVAQVIRRHTSRDVRVVPHGVDFSVFSPDRTIDPKYVLWNKTRVDAVCDPTPVNEVARLMPSVPFQSTHGDPSIANLDISGKLPFLDAIEQVRGAAVYLCTSRETFGIGTLEALACGVPVVYYNYGGQAEILTSGFDGEAVAPGDYEGLARAIAKVLEDRDRYSLNAVATASKYSWTYACKAYKAIYREAIEKRAALQDGVRTTIVVPAYNLEQYLPDTLDSVLAQTDEDWECIVVDDASPDRCGEIADDYASRDPRIRVIHNKENQYLAEARNIAIAQAKGRYILPLDADDMLPRNAVKLLADTLETERNLDIVYGNVLFTEQDGRTPRNYGVAGHTPGHSGWPMPMDPYYQIQGRNLLPYSSMYRRRVWEQTAGYRQRLVTAEDADFWTRAVSYGFTAKLVTGDDTLIYRNREGSMSRVNDDKREAYLKWYPWAKDPSLAPAGLAGRYAVALNTPRISVVIPVGPGHEHLVIDAVDSVSAQSFPRWECIVVNDSGSKLMLPPWVREVISDHRDPGMARNQGIAAANTPLYVALDADDMLMPNALQWLAAAYTEVAQSTGREDVIIYPDFFEDPEEEGKHSVYETPDFDCQRLITNGAIHAITALTPVSVWKAVGGYKPLLGWEDWDFQLACADHGVCSYRVTAPLFYYRKFTGKRRNYDKEEFETRKQQILRTWSAYFSGEKTMACGCAGGASITPSGERAASSNVASMDNATQVQYIGGKAGAIRYRGAGSNKIYEFAKGDTKWVLNSDLPTFNRADFRVVGANEPIGSLV